MCNGDDSISTRRKAQFSVILLLFFSVQKVKSFGLIFFNSKEIHFLYGGGWRVWNLIFCNTSPQCLGNLIFPVLRR